MEKSQDIAKKINSTEHNNGRQQDILGIHHVTAIASDPQKNIDFYTHILGLRLVKLTVNFDDPTTYHIYFGDEIGRPGTILTFFPWPNARKQDKKRKLYLPILLSLNIWSFYYGFNV
jgi:Glyoxalase/Bleomycin resistance protein/Dioxygenase superfamily